MRFIKRLSKLSLKLRSKYLYPSYVQMEPTTKCNLKCVTCLRTQLRSKVNNDMKLELFKSIIDQLRGPLYKTREINLTGLGEPFLNPNIVEMVKYAKFKGLRINMVTNLMVATEDLLIELIKAKMDSLSISFDGAKKETFEKIRVGAVFEEVINKISFIIKTKKEMQTDKPKIFLNSTIIKENVEEIVEMVEIAEKLGVNGIYFMKRILPGVRYSDINIPNLDKQLKKVYSSKVKVDLSYLQEGVYPCMIPRTCYITYDGKVMPCNELMELIPRDEYPRYQLGDLTRESFSKIWFSPSYVQLRLRIINGERLPFCENCQGFIT